jgi:hypothetical protein
MDAVYVELLPVHFADVWDLERQKTNDIKNTSCTHIAFTLDEEWDTDIALAYNGTAVLNGTHSSFDCNRDT